MKVSLTDWKLHCLCGEKKINTRKRVRMSGSKTSSECFVKPGEFQKLHIIPQCSKSGFWELSWFSGASPVWGCNSSNSRGSVRVLPRPVERHQPWQALLQEHPSPGDGNGLFQTPQQGLEGLEPSTKGSATITNQSMQSPGF